MSDAVHHICPVCGYPDLDIGPLRGNDSSYEICASCGFEFGVTDMDKGYSYAQWREKWIQEGLKWWFRPEKNIPLSWNPREQLKNIGVFI